jgi:8-amino-7-oxononanoate synthase
VSPDPINSLIAAELADLEERHLLRRRRAVRILDAIHLEIDGKRFVNFAANNYLGMTHHPNVLQTAQDAMRTHGFGGGAAPLVTGYTDLHAAAEEGIARWKGTEDAVLLPSGFQANHAAVGAIVAVAESGGKRVRFLLDKLVHASLIDAVRATGRSFRVFPHNGIAKLQRLLEDADPAEIQVVATESIFSMEGDAADLPALAALKHQRPFILLLDEAHGSGVYGPNGAGYAAELGLRGAVDVSVITLSKALGAVGGAICGSRQFCEAVVNFGRAYLFSTSLPAMVPAAVMASIRILHDEPARQARLRELSARVRRRLTDTKLNIPKGDSPIIPILCGSEQGALAAANALREQGLLVVAIRPPTVPRGTSRLRVTLSCEHTDEEIEKLVAALASSVPPSA